MPKAMNRPDPSRRARAARERALKTAMRRKEEYLGARVPRALKERVLIQAEREGIPVSLLIRRTLEAAFPGEGERAAAPSAPVPDPAPFSAVLAWQPLELARDGTCAACGRALSAGERGWLAVGMEPAPVVVCTPCKEALGTAGG